MAFWLLARDNNPWCMPRPKRKFGVRSVYFWKDRREDRRQAKLNYGFISTYEETFFLKQEFHGASRGAQ
jgi:hypothetical protein